MVTAPLVYGVVIYSTKSMLLPWMVVKAPAASVASLAVRREESARNSSIISNQKLIYAAELNPLRIGVVACHRILPNTGLALPRG